MHRGGFNTLYRQLTGSERLSLFRTIESGQNRQLGFEAVPKAKYPNRNSLNLRDASPFSTQKQANSDLLINHMILLCIVLQNSNCTNVDKCTACPRKSGPGKLLTNMVLYNKTFLTATLFTYHSQKTGMIFIC